jgi:hypothetical protein
MEFLLQEAIKRCKLLFGVSDLRNHLHGYGVFLLPVPKLDESA